MPRRIAAAILAILWIAFMWAKKDVASAYASMPREQMLPLLVTTFLVTALKIAALAAAVYFIKKIVGRIARK